MVDVNDAARGTDETDTDRSLPSQPAAEDRRRRPLAWLSEPEDRQHDLQAWLDYRSTMIGSARAERSRR
jgi:hypothetical protein